MQGIKSIVQRLNSDSYLKYKENKIRQQNGTSGNCGWFCCQFLIDRLRGKKFAECSGYNDMIKGEKDIVAFKKKHNINKFDYFNQDGQGIGSFLKRGIKAIGSKIGEVVDRFKGPLRDSDYPPVVRKFMYKFQYSPITSISIGRKPLNSIITRMGNWLSSGKLGENVKKLNYDDIYHLYLVVELGNNPKLTYVIEKNEVITIQRYKPDPKETLLHVSEPKNLTVKQFFLDGLDEYKKVGKNMYLYDARNNNCQWFVRNLLKGQRTWTSTIEKFVMQDGEKLVEGLESLGDNAKSVTDFAARVNIILNGRGRK